MTTTPEIADEKGSINPIENLSGWIDKHLEQMRDAEPADTSGQPDAASSAEPASAPPAPQAVEPTADPLAGDWWETGLPANHGFLKGRKGEEVERAFRNGELTWKQAQTENARLRRELEDTRRRSAEAPAPAPVAPVQQPQNTEEEINQLWFENPAEAKRLMVEEAKREALGAVKAEREAETFAAEQRTAEEASRSVADYLVAARGYDAAQAARTVIATYPLLQQLRDQGRSDAFTDPRVVLWMVDQILEPARSAAPPTAAPAAEVPPTPAPSMPNPPGTKRPAALNARPATANPLRAEQEEVRRSIAEELGIDPQRLIDRAKARGGNRGR